jgi:flagellar basal body-associated protein FliL
VNFLTKIEEAINRLIESLLKNCSKLIPDFVFSFITFLKHLPAILKNKYQIYWPKARVLCLKLIGYTLHYATIMRGYFINFLIYLRSEEFKKIDKVTLLLMPIKYVKHNPLKSISGLLSLIIFGIAISTIFQNVEKIALGTHALRKPASMENAEEDLYIELKNHKFEVKLVPKGGHGGGGEAHEIELYLDVKIEASSTTDKEFLEVMEEMLDDNLEAMELTVSQMPLTDENKKKIEEVMVKSLNTDFQRFGYEHIIKHISLKQILPSRPVYYRQAERMMSLTEINLQIFLEDTNRNRQVWIDFSVLASNRNVILYLTDHEIELKDHLTSNVEPVIPQLPVEEEGRQIIKEKMRIEINQFLEKNGIEGKILEVYLNYLMVS